MTRMKPADGLKSRNERSRMEKSSRTIREVLKINKGRKKLLPFPTTVFAVGIGIITLTSLSTLAFQTDVKVNQIAGPSGKSYPPPPKPNDDTNNSWWNLVSKLYS